MNSSTQTFRCLAFGHLWQIESERWINPNRHDMGGRRIYYCTRCLTKREVKT